MAAFRVRRTGTLSRVRGASPVARLRGAEGGGGNTYTDSLTLTGNATVSVTGLLTMIASAGLAANATLSPLAGLVLTDTVGLAGNATVNLAAVLTLLGSLTLGGDATVAFLFDSNQQARAIVALVSPSHDVDTWAMPSARPDPLVMPSHDVDVVAAYPSALVDPDAWPSAALVELETS